MEILVKRPNLEKLRVKQVYQPQRIVTDTMLVKQWAVIQVGGGNTWPQDSLYHFRAVLREPDYIVKQVIAERDSLIGITTDNIRVLFFYGDLTVKYGRTGKGIPERLSYIRLMHSNPVAI